MTLADFATSPWVLYALGALFVIVKIAEASPGILGGFSRGIAERAERKRLAASEQDDADITELNRKVTNLTEMLAAERAESAAHRQTIQDLYVYILAAQRDPERLRDPVPMLRTVPRADDTA